jgi:hypothetical protein
MKTIWMILLGLSAYGYEIVIEKTATQFQRDDAKEVVIDTKNKLMWQDDESVKTTEKDWSGAISYCDNLSFAGFSDWRLPSYKELLSLSNPNLDSPAVQSSFKNISSNDFWSNSGYGSDYARMVFFGSGHGSHSPIWYNLNICCVRNNK